MAHAWKCVSFTAFVGMEFYTELKRRTPKLRFDVRFKCACDGKKDEKVEVATLLGPNLSPADPADCEALKDD